MFLFLDTRAISKGSPGEWVTFPSLSLKVGCSLSTKIRVVVVIIDNSLEGARPAYSNQATEMSQILRFKKWCFGNM